jgi:hypothetical protein
MKHSSSLWIYMRYDIYVATYIDEFYLSMAWKLVSKLVPLNSEAD